MVLGELNIFMGTDMGKIATPTDNELRQRQDSHLGPIAFISLYSRRTLTFCSYRSLGLIHDLVVRNNKYFSMALQRQDMIGMSDAEVF